jgi:hypothetical protein
MKRLTNTLFLLLGLTSIPALAQIPNAGFEEWDSLSIINGVRIMDPTEWWSSNTELFTFNETQTVELTTDAHSGTYAVKLTSALNDEEKQGTYISSGRTIGESPNDPNTSKFPLQGRINGFEGYYKYFPVTNDSFRVYIALFRKGQYVGQAFMAKGTPANTYTKFSWPINFPSTIPAPDSAKFIIEPSIYQQSEGSVLYIDDLNLTYGFATGTTEKFALPKVSLLPNPAHDKITLLGYDPRHRYAYEIVDITGKIIQSGKLFKDELSIDNLKNGLYVLTLINAEGQASNHKFVKQ